jgi:electron transport complex protein RnfC
VTIQCDRQAPAREYAAGDWTRQDPAELLGRVRAAGIVGMGGAGFPTHVKLAPPPGATIDTLIVNGAECEPYLTTDHRLMLEDAAAIVEGARVMLAILGIRRCAIGIEANKMDAVEAMREAADAAEAEIDVHALRVKYPQGAEKQLIQAITGRRVPSGGLPFHVGVVVQNTGTAIAVRDAAVLGKPVYQKVITVSGCGVRRPANLRVRVGTRLRDIASHLGGTTPDLARIVIGGPMTGFAVSSLDLAVTKTTSGVLFLGEGELDDRPPANCIRCGWCVDACPMGVQPGEFAMHVEAGKAELTAPFGVFDCFECGSCTYVCPARRPIVQYVRLAKRKAKR